ncbi:MAG: hypothetical protein AAB676_17285, partial [Verrucomicrobiota bacterium]
YADNGAYTVTVTVTDDDGGVTADQFNVLVLNVAPSLLMTGSNFNVDASNTPIAFSGVRGQILTFQGGLTDPGFDNPHNPNGASVERFTYRINYGDGTPEVTGAARIDGVGGPGAPTTGSLQEVHIFTKEGVYMVTTTVTDDDGGTVLVKKTVTIEIAAVQVDQTDSNKRVLAVGGTVFADEIEVEREDNPALIEVEIETNDSHSEYEKVFNANVARTLVFGQAGDDKIKVEGKLDSLQFGGLGNDKLQGGKGNNVLVGAEGDDFLNGASSRDILIGGHGVDRLVGSSGEDLIVAGYTDFDTNTMALTALQAEWISTRDSATRIANLAGTASSTTPRLNGSFFLKADSTDLGRVLLGTVHDDRSVDKITGSSGPDWIFANIDGGVGNFKDTITDNDKRRILSDVDYVP